MAMLDLKRDEKGRVIDKEHFRNMFKNRTGAPNTYIEADKDIIEKYRDVLPNELLYYWGTYGFSSFKEGLFWLTNPEDYTELVEEYFKNTVFENRPNLYVVARSAFGQLFLWESGKGATLDLNSFSNMIFLDAVADRENLNKTEEDYAMNRFLAKNPEHFDEEDGSGKALFERCLKKFGKLEANEMYGYKLSHFLGGKESITNITKMDLFNHYSIQKELKAPTISISDTENNTLTWG